MKPIIVLPLIFPACGCADQPVHKTSAVVLNIAPHANPKCSPDEVVVTARSVDGVVGMKCVRLANLDCRIGDRVAATV
ncbi:hypothetical protein GGR44_001996 [Sphingobium fontiphilum]|uniref:Uncharacterized protein n=1 Tax=Sphingobium fontiphilum TaxID=944425 RepID=A0A7W6DM02_9SPHN|nr:hypothetical protein [Sphingobium fontiphilum]MBB3982333.1 hypothetical protein [Sphingobium fontiphilum]